ncbi:MAG: YdeI/OmpD-associated family protein [Tahibacter sp.]
MPKSLTDEPLMLFETSVVWSSWLAKHGSSSKGVWLRLAKKNSGATSVTYAEAVEVALCHGWIDGHKKADDERFWLQRFTPRSTKSIWSKINRGKALVLIEQGKMRAAGLREIQRAKDDGRWEGAYDSPSVASVPDDFQAALDGNRKAKAFFATLDGANRYAMLFRIQNVKKAETRANKILQFVRMLENHETIHAPRKRAPRAAGK